MICKTHPKYRGLSKPRSYCEDCWAYWLGMANACRDCGCEVKAQQILNKL